MKVVICPVCNGTGQICTGIDQESTSAVPILKRCHGCDGKGWVLVPEYTITYRPGNKPEHPSRQVW